MELETALEKMRVLSVKLAQYVLVHRQRMQSADLIYSLHNMLMNDLKKLISDETRVRANAASIANREQSNQFLDDTLRAFVRRCVHLNNVIRKVIEKIPHDLGTLESEGSIQDDLSIVRDDSGRYETALNIWRQSVGLPPERRIDSPISLTAHYILAGFVASVAAVLSALVVQQLLSRSLRACNSNAVNLRGPRHST